jgi:hypothetical protein
MDMKYRSSDLNSRIFLLTKIIDILDRQSSPISAKDIQISLSKLEISVTKKIVNSILFSEGKRYVDHDRKTYSYSLKKMSEDDVRVPLLTDSSDFDKEKSTYNEVAQEKLTVYLSNRSYVFLTKKMPSSHLFSIREIGSKVSIYVNEAHPFYQKHSTMFNGKESQERIMFEEILISLSEVYVNSPEGIQRDRVDDFNHALSRALKAIASEGIS